jgi:hypothetical protein
MRSGSFFRKRRARIGFKQSPHPDPHGFDQSPTWQPEEVQLDDGRTLVPAYT